MNVSLAKKNPFAGVRTFYVDSETEEDVRYMVVEVKREGHSGYYCQCNDFFGRWLPLIGLNVGGFCKHIKATREAIGK